MKDRLLALLYTFPFAAAMIYVGHVLIEQSNIVISEDYKDQLSGAGTILQWMGGMSVLLVIFELVMWPWYSIKEAWDKSQERSGVRRADGAGLAHSLRFSDPRFFVEFWLKLAILLA